MHKTGKKIWARITGKHRAPRVYITHPDYLNGRNLYKSAVNTSIYIDGLLLDVGSGKSVYFDIYRKSNKNFKYFSIDYPASRDVMLVESEKPHIYGDAHCLPVKSNKVDVVLLNQVLEHVAEPDRVLAEINRILKESGVLVISVPFIYQIHGEPYDYYRFSKYGINYLLEKNGFEVCEFMCNGYFGTTIVVLVNGFIMEVFTMNTLLKILGFFIMPLLFTLTNVVGLISELVLEKLYKLEAFTPNYWVVAKKV